MIRKVFSLYRRNRFITLPLYHITRPPKFDATLKFLNESEQWPKEEMQQWQLRQIIDIVNYAFEHVPYYRALYKSVGFCAGDIHTIDDFKLLPTIKKDDIKRNPTLFLSDEADKIPKVISHTGGSTNKPMEFWLDADMDPRENAFYEYYWKKYGFGYGDRFVVLRGNSIPRKGGGVPFYYDRLLNQKIFDSSYVSDPDMTPIYDKEIRAFKPKTVFAYPSILYMLAKNYELQNIQAPTIGNAFVSSESIYAPQAEIIKRVFHINNFLYGYGHSERVLLALKYAQREELGFIPQYGYVELLDRNENNIHNIGISGEITGTSWSKVMPFIRYKTGDYATLSEYQSDDFMHNCISVRRIEGREQEYIVLNDGRKMPLVNIAGAHLPSLSLIGDMQYVQTLPGELIIRATSIRSGDVISPEIMDNVRNDICRSVRNALNVHVEQVNEIERTQAGKKIMLIQKSID